MVSETEPKRKPGRPKGQRVTGAAAAGPGPGRPKGCQDKLTVDIKRMIEEALHQVGGAEYLAQRAVDTPGPFMALVGKLLPKDVNVTANAGSELLMAMMEIAKSRDPPG